MLNVDNSQASPLNGKGLQNAYWICRLFVVVQIGLCFILSLGDRGRIMAALVVCISIILGDRFRLSKSLHTILIVCSGSFFSCFALYRFFGDRSAGLLDLFELLAEYLIIVQSLELLRKRADSLWSYREANYLPGLGTIAIIMLLVSRDVPLNLSTLAYLFSGLAVLLALVMSPDFVSLIMGNRLQRRKAVMLSTIVAVGTAAGSLFRGEVSQQLPLLQAALRTVQPPNHEIERKVVRSKARLVDRVDLSSVSAAQRAAPDESVFRVESGQLPGYMRTLSFEKFDGNGWLNNWIVEGRKAIGARRISPLATLPVELASVSKPNDAELFELPDRQGGNYVEMKIIVPSGHGRQVPFPLTSAYILAASQGRTRELILDMHGNIWPNSINNNEYRVFAGASANWPVDDNYAMRLLQLPESDADFIKLHSAKICGSALTTRDKVQALVEYFAGEFEYSFESNAIGERLGRSLLRAFLENRKAGHCEYFATASTLLLRAQGIPCRLSTGYLVYEMNEDREYYYARNRDAHAWAEAYDEDSREWILVESTPGIRAYVESFRADESALVQMNNGLASIEYSFASIFVELFNIIRACWAQVVASRFAWLIPLALSGVFWAIRARRVRVTENAEVVPISRAVRQADRRAMRMGFQRASSETCLQFSRRLSETPVPELVLLAEWYATFSQSRYIEKPSKS